MLHYAAARCNLHIGDRSIASMKKLLRPGDVLLLGLAGAMDIFETVKDPLGVMARGSEALYGWVPPRYRRHNFSRVVARQMKTGDIEKVVKGDQVYLRLTSVGREKIARDFPMFSLSQKPWDKRWRVVIFDISELNKRIRDSLRNKLRELGFGMMQESVWVTPYDVSMDMREFLEHHDLGGVAFVLEVSEILAGDTEALIGKIWKLDALEKEYQEIINDVTQLQSMYVTPRGREVQHTSMHRKEKERNRNIRENVREIRERYVQAVLSDPCLPNELLPNDWPEKKAREAIEELKKLLAE